MVVKQTVEKPKQNSHLFMLRMWPEDLGGGQTDWRGSIQYVNSGELRYFRDWLTLQDFVENMLRRNAPQVLCADKEEHTDDESDSPVSQ